MVHNSRRKWVAEILLIADKTTAELSLLTQGQEITHPTHPHAILLTWRYRMWMLTTIKKPLASPFFELGKRVLAIRRRKWLPPPSVWLPVTSAQLWNVSSPYKRNYFNLPAPFDLPWPFTAEAASKRLHQKLQRFVSLSLIFLLSSTFSESLALSILYRQKLGVANTLSLAHQKWKRKTRQIEICCGISFTNVGVNTEKRSLMSYSLRNWWDFISLWLYLYNIRQINLTDWLTNWLIDWVVGWLVGWLVDWLIDHKTGCLDFSSII